MTNIAWSSHPVLSFRTIWPFWQSLHRFYFYRFLTLWVQLCFTFRGFNVWSVPEQGTEARPRHWVCLCTFFKQTVSLFVVCFFSQTSPDKMIQRCSWNPASKSVSLKYELLLGRLGINGAGLTQTTEGGQTPSYTFWHFFLSLWRFKSSFSLFCLPLSATELLTMNRLMTHPDTAQTHGFTLNTDGKTLCFQKRLIFEASTLWTPT